MEQYNEVIESLLNKGYVQKIECRKLTSEGRIWYLPHHPVINPKKPGKVRIVLDCAAKYAGTCINDCLYPGPDTTASLVGILLRFRRHPIAMAADIEEMLLQVKVP